MNLKTSKAHRINKLIKKNILVPKTRFLKKSDFKDISFYEIFPNEKINKIILRSSFPKEDSEKPLAGVFPTITNVSKSSFEKDKKKFIKLCNNLENKFSVDSYEVIIQEFIQCDISGLIHLDHDKRKILYLEGEKNPEDLVLGKGLFSEKNIFPLDNLKKNHSILYSEIKKIKGFIKKPSLVEWGMKKDQIYIFQVRPIKKSNLLNESSFNLQYGFLNDDFSKFEKLIINQVYKQNGSFHKVIKKISKNRSLKEYIDSDYFDEIFTINYEFSFMKIAFFMFKMPYFVNSLKSFLSDFNFELTKEKIENYLNLIDKVSLFSFKCNYYINVLSELKLSKYELTPRTIKFNRFIFDYDFYNSFFKKKDSILNQIKLNLNQSIKKSSDFEFLFKSKNIIADIFNYILIEFYSYYKENINEFEGYNQTLKFRSLKRPKRGKFLGFSNLKETIKGRIGTEILILNRFDYNLFPFKEELKAIIVKSSHPLSHPYILCDSHDIGFIYNLNNFEKIKEFQGTLKITPIEVGSVKLELI
ncbi:MAG: hypothetical protein ACOCRX_03575 [Candidatus Woesearchaeota archaeon]